jgi:Fur family ferric uptake transcriptional regulator
MTPSRSETGLSKSHRLVYRIVKDQGVGRHLPMTEVFDLARARQDGIGFTTVYRALTRLRDAGLISEIVVPGADRAYYEPAAEPHAHFRCIGCGSITDVAYSLPGEAMAAIATQLGAHVTGATVTVQGRCGSCARSST